MILSKFALPVLGLIAFSSVGLIYTINKYFYSNNEVYPNEVNEVLFFSNEGGTCRVHFINEENKKICSLPNCSFNNLSRMMYFLNNAQHTLDVCLYLITVRDLCDAIIKAERRGVKVRIITDEDLSNSSGSMIPKFRQNGLFVRTPKESRMLMHHKFVVIDNEILMQGSLNWTMQAVCGNWDNLLITSSQPLVHQYQINFDKLWHQLL